jgi:hypothetical protein
MKKINEKMLQIAASYNYFTPENLPENIKNDAYFADHYSHFYGRLNSVLIPEGLDLFPEFDICVFMAVRQNFKNMTNDHESYYLDNCYLCIYSEKHDLLLQVQSNNLTKGKYYLYPIYPMINKLQRFTSYDQRKPFLKDLKEPNNMGAFSVKKLNDWFAYCNDYITAHNKCNDFMNDKKAQNLAFIQETINSLPYAKVQSYQDRIYITTPNFEIKFELCDNSTYLHQQIRFTGTLQTIIEKKL